MKNNSITITSPYILFILFIQNVYSALVTNKRALMRYSIMDVDKCN